MSKIVLSLITPAGPFVFTGAEVPEHIRQGGTHALSIDRMIGGRRIVRPLGPDEDDITFSGIFAYQGTARSDFLDSVRRRGDLCTLKWDNRLMLVLIGAYRPDYAKPYIVGYTITFTVVANQSALVTAVPAVTPMQQLNIDMGTLNQQTACAGIPALSTAASAISSALTSMQAAAAPIAKGLRPISDTLGQAGQCINQIANQIQTATAAVAAPIAQLISNTQALITNAETAIASAASFGGIIPGNPVALEVAKFSNNVNSIVQLPALYGIRSVATRMQSNLALTAMPATSKTIAYSGGTLYDVAAQQYGDGNLWQKIAVANHLTDPSLSGINTLTIPA